MKHPLEEAIKLHQKHMDKPTTATKKSQEEMMKLLKEHKKNMEKNTKEYMSCAKS